MESIATYTLLRWINSSTTEQHIETSDRLVTLFLKMYGTTPNYQRLCNALQLARIEILHTNAISA